MNQPKKSSEPVTRRQFIQSSTLAVGGALAGSLALRQGVFAAGADSMKVALIGCGGRGSGALNDCIEAAKMLKINLKVVATADAIKDRAEGVGQRHGLSKDACFSGFDSYKKAIAAGPDVVLIATSPNFRPVHFEAAVKAGKHVFMEKPVAVDPPGARKVIASGEEAEARRVCPSWPARSGGTRRPTCETHAAVSQGAIGKILGGRSAGAAERSGTRTATRARPTPATWSATGSASPKCRGDHIVEQHVHNIDVANWFIGRPPVSCRRLWRPGPAA